jgi:hypothetical protein
MYQVGEAAVWTLGRLGQAGHVTEGPVNTGKRSIADLYETARAMLLIPKCSHSNHYFLLFCLGTTRPVVEELNAARAREHRQATGASPLLPTLWTYPYDKSCRDWEFHTYPLPKVG